MVTGLTSLTWSAISIPCFRCLADQLGRLGMVKLLPGMPVETFIATEERTVLSYLVKPLSDQVLHAFRQQ